MELLPVILQAEVAAAFICNHFALSYPGKRSEDVGFLNSQQENKSAMNDPMSNPQFCSLQ